MMVGARASEGEGAGEGGAREGAGGAVSFRGTPEVKRPEQDWERAESSRDLKEQSSRKLGGERERWSACPDPASLVTSCRTFWRYSRTKAFIAWNFGILVFTLESVEAFGFSSQS